MSSLHPGVYPGIFPSICRSVCLCFLFGVVGIILIVLIAKYGEYSRNLEAVVMFLYGSTALCTLCALIGVIAMIWFEYRVYCAEKHRATLRESLI